MLAACGKPATETKAEPVRKYDLHGEVLRLDSKDNLATIKHEKIGDWMGAMTMEYSVKPDAEFQKLHVGDKIQATVVVEGDIKYYVTDIKVK